MMIVHLRMIEIRITSFSATDSSVSLEIHFDDGRVKQIYRTTSINNPQEEAAEIIEDLVKMEKNINKEFTGRLLEGEVHVVFEDEDTVKQKITSFLRTVASKVLKAKNDNDPHRYLDAIGELIRTKVFFQKE